MKLDWVEGLALIGNGKLAAVLSDRRLVILRTKDLVLLATRKLRSAPTCVSSDGAGRLVVGYGDTTADVFSIRDTTDLDKSSESPR